MRETEKEEGGRGGKRSEKKEEGEEERRGKGREKIKSLNIRTMTTLVFYFKKMGSRHTLPAGLPPSCRRRLQSPLGST